MIGLYWPKPVLLEDRVQMRLVHTLMVLNGFVPTEVSVHQRGRPSIGWFQFGLPSLRVHMPSWYEYGGDNLRAFGP